jgi:hypothetical protein
MIQFAETHVLDVVKGENMEIMRAILGGSSRMRNSLFNGGFVAGGFARALLRGDSLREYFSPSDKKGVYGHAGDVDVFFTSEEGAKTTTSSFNDRRSMAGFAQETTDWVSMTSATIPDKRNITFKVQLIDRSDLISKTPEECISRFDMVNCQVALVGDVLIHPKEWHELEASRKIRINQIHSPFLGSRILKYTKYRGYDGIEASSYPLLVEWLAKAAGDNFPGFTERHLNGVQSAVKRLREGGHIDKSDLIMFLGKWTENVELNGDTYQMRANGWSPTEIVQVDWAMNEIGQNV